MNNDNKKEKEKDEHHKPEDMNSVYENSQTKITWKKMLKWEKCWMVIVMVRGPYTVHEYNKHNSKSMSLQTNQNQNQMSESSSINHNEKMKIFEVAFLKN